MPGDSTTKMSIDYRENDTNLARRHFSVHRKKIVLMKIYGNCHIKD